MICAHSTNPQIRDIDRLLATLTKACPNLKYLSLLGNQACPNELLGSGHDDEDYQRYRSVWLMYFTLLLLVFLEHTYVGTEKMKSTKVQTLGGKLASSIAVCWAVRHRWSQ